MPHNLSALVTPQRSWHRWGWLVLAVVWTAMLWSTATDHPWATSSLGIAYVWLAGLPAAAMLAHAAYPTRLGWGALGLLATGSFAFAATEALRGVVGDQGGAKYMEGRTLGLAVALAVQLSLVAGLLYVLRPRPASSAG